MSEKTADDLFNQMMSEYPDLHEHIKKVRKRNVIMTREWKKKNSDKLAKYYSTIKERANNRCRLCNVLIMPKSKTCHSHKWKYRKKKYNMSVLKRGHVQSKGRTKCEKCKYLVFNHESTCINCGYINKNYILYGGDKIGKRSN